MQRGIQRAYGDRAAAPFRRRQRPQIPGQFVQGVVLGVGQVVGQRAPVQRVGALAELRPQVQQAAPGLLPVPGVQEHHDLPDPRQHRVRRRLPLSLRHRVLRPSSAGPTRR
ncbi:hypothetical protein KJK32_07750 [Streptomyces sp. JCM17656]|nr:hypothetical protein KJK32_07750 [Streptomyces sp. JCM17656]